MAIWYANSITGNDGNGGTSWADAKKTLAGANGLATANVDTIYCHGRFTESLPATKQGLRWNGVGECILDGGNSITGAAVQNNTVIRELVLEKFVTYALSFGNAISASIERCVFRNQAVGIIRTSDWNGFVYVLVTRFADHSTAAVDWNGYSGLHLFNCTFRGNAIGVLQSAANVSRFIIARQCAFADAIMVKRTSTGTFQFDNNAYDFTNGKCVDVSTDKTTLAAWQAVTGVDVSSVHRVLPSDLAGNTLRATPSSGLLSAGPGGTPIGMMQPAAVISNNVNASIWTGGTFSNTEIDGSGNLVLSAGQTLGTWTSGELDLGAAIAVRSIELSIANETTTAFVDSSIADSPGYLTVELRGSNTSPVSGSYTAVPRRAEIGAYMTSTYRYWQIKLTLRA